MSFKFIKPEDLPKSGLTAMVETLVEDVRKAHNEALDGWLKTCVEKWCPLAFEVAKSNPKVAAEILKDKGFHWTREMAGADWIATFWKNETRLMCCRLEVRLLNPEYERATEWRFMFHPDAFKK